MKQTYNKPTCMAINIDEAEMLAQSGDTPTVFSLGDEYSESDVSYTKEAGKGSLWENEW